MATVLIRDIPEALVSRLKRIAKRNKRSLQQELRAALELRVSQSSPDLFQKVKDLRADLRRKPIRFSDSAKILREDRRR
ncbi:MAG: hypothetical protein HXY45_02120 [Syntrophaceae bacterium]|nr:hypothetical protein [Syntrophaceae bacterium]